MFHAQVKIVLKFKEQTKLFINHCIIQAHHQAWARPGFPGNCPGCPASDKIEYFTKKLYS